MEGWVSAGLEAGCMCSSVLMGHRGAKCVVGKVVVAQAKWGPR